MLLLIIMDLSLHVIVNFRHKMLSRGAALGTPTRLLMAFTSRLPHRVLLMLISHSTMLLMVACCTARPHIVSNGLACERCTAAIVLVMVMAHSLTAIASPQWTVRPTLITLLIRAEF